MLELIFFVFLFAAGTLLLYQTKHERHFIFFLIRTKHFLRVIEKIANSVPKLWRFFADVAIVFSFSGVGAAYLSKYREENKNLDVILLVLGLFSILIWSDDIILASVMFPALVLGVFSLARLKNPLFDFVVASVIISSILLNAMHWYIAALEGCFGVLAIVAGSLVKNAFDITVGQSNIPGVSPIIPWSRAGQWGFILPGLGVFVPLGYGLVAMIMLIFVHEFAHGVLARVHGLELKSTGILTLGILPIGAFIEPDEDAFNKSESIKKMRVLAVGSFSNMLLAVASFFFFVLLVSPSGSWVIAESNIKALENGTTIESIDGINLSTGNYINAAAEANLYSNRVYGIREEAFRNKSLINITTSSGVFVFRPNEISGIKLKYLPEYRFNKPFFGIAFGEILALIFFWLYFFNLNIALVNLLPIAPFDGGKMVMELFSVFHLSEGKTLDIAYFLLALVFIIILINAYPLIHMVFDWFF